MGDVESPTALSLAAAVAGPAGIRDTPPSDEASPWPVVIILDSDVKLCAAEPACVAIEQRSSAGVAMPPACAPVLTCRAELPLAMLLASLVTAPRLPALLMWLMEPV